MDDFPAPASVRVRYVMHIRQRRLFHKICRKLPQCGHIQTSKTDPADALTAKGTQLEEGENVINIYYYKTIDTRKTTSATVYHKYYHDAAYAYRDALSTAS